MVISNKEYTLKELKFNELMQYLKEKKGATITKIENTYYFIEYKEGYQVALKDNEYIFTDLKKDLLKFIDLLMSMENYQETGLWLDIKSNKLYVDLHTLHFEEKDTALMIARFNEQLAIYDWANKDSIYLKKEGE